MLVFTSSFFGNKYSSEAQYTDALTEAIENRVCSSMSLGWDVSVTGEWNDNVYIITINCDEGGTRSCPQVIE